MICLRCGHYRHPDQEMARVQRSDDCPCACHSDPPVKQGAPMTDEQAPFEHPSFTRAKALPEPIRNYFPTSVDEARMWQPSMLYRALAAQVLVVAQTRVECAWAAYCDAVPGINHEAECHDVLKNGAKLDEPLARLLFPIFDGVPYAR